MCSCQAAYDEFQLELLCRRPPMCGYLLSAALLLVGLSPLCAQESWKGRVILIKERGLRAKKVDSSGRELNVPLINFNYNVLDEKDGKLLLDHAGAGGWLDKGKTVPL